MVFKNKNSSKTKFHRNGLLATFSSNFQEGQIRNTIIKQKMNVVRSLLDNIKTKQLQWYRHVQKMEEGRLPKKFWNGVHQEEENKVDLNLPGRKGLEDWWEKWD